MRLSYLGVNYEGVPSTLEVTEREINSTYRGQNNHFHYLRHIPEPPLPNNRQHRGITHHTPQPVSPIPVRKTSVTRNPREVLDEMMSSHWRNSQRRLEHQL